MKQMDSIATGQPDSPTGVVSQLRFRISRVLSAGGPAFVLLLSGCAGASGSEMKTSPSHDVLSREEIASLVSATTAYEAIQQVRPRWFRTRGTQSMYLSTPIKVYVNGIQRHGDIGVLRTIPSSIIAKIAFLSARDATVRWGSGHRCGAIEVTTLKTPSRKLDPRQS